MLTSIVLNEAKGVVYNPKFFFFLILKIGRSAFVLEGGYNLRSLTRSAEAVMRVVLGQEYQTVDETQVSSCCRESIARTILSIQKYWPGTDFGMPLQVCRALLPGREESADENSVRNYNEEVLKFAVQCAMKFLRRKSFITKKACKSVRWMQREGFSLRLLRKYCVSKQSCRRFLQVAVAKHSKRASNNVPSHLLAAIADEFFEWFVHRNTLSCRKVRWKKETVSGRRHRLGMLMQVLSPS